ncbi:hypothetical protein P7K49_007112 [Saguinus oedipus]|uniref:Uncharacterized protein n=1 Tax=Saguinus oedipus TaxID=9490 RepID=A0ABQ9VTW8_SAGOE|nr:hypothetical protein P7K49_007112 [Saguinus oedipus]
MFAHRLHRGSKGIFNNPTNEGSVVYSEKETKSEDSSMPREDTSASLALEICTESTQSSLGQLELQNPKLQASANSDNKNLVPVQVKRNSRGPKAGKMEEAMKKVKERKPHSGNHVVVVSLCEYPKRKRKWSYLYAKREPEVQELMTAID